MTHLFISYSRKNKQAVQQLKDDLQAEGLTIWIDSVGLQPGTPDWDQALRDAIHEASAVLLCASPSSRRSPYVRDEIALAKSEQKPIYPLWIAGDDWLDCIPMGLGSTQHIDLRSDTYHANLPRLIGAFNGNTTSETVEPVEPIVSKDEVSKRVSDPRNPYKGLQAFRAEDRNDFFGREVLVEELVTFVDEQMQLARILAVLGASGSGKSSVMMAGLLPKLQQEHPEWLFLDPMVPTVHPLEKLTITLARQFENKSQTAIREDLLDRSTRGLHRVACELSDKPIVLYIDQFEELFTLVDTESDRRHFIDLLTTAVTEPDGVLILLLSMRADFYDRPAQYREFGSLIEKQHVLITPMTLADLYDVVQKPARLPDVGLQFEENLVTEMVFAVREEAAALPLLQFTLEQLFEQCDGNTLTWQAYEEIGGIQGALAQHAEATYNNLPSTQHKQLARALFLRLIEPGQTEQDTTRRRASYSELTLPDAEQTRILQETADAFVDARLLVSDQSDDTRTLEVSHEALIREWERLGTWLHDAREDLRLQKSLAADVAEWQRRRNPDDMLYRGTVLSDAQAWAERNTASRDETRFLNRSQEVEAERQEQEARAARNLRYALFGLVGVVFLASIGLALIFARSNADLQTEAATLEANSTIFVQNNTNLQKEAATSQAMAATFEFQGEYVQAQVNWSATREFPVGFDELTQTPAPAFLATATAQADLATTWEPVIETFDGVEMVLVPAGCFWMGSNTGDPDEQPVHEQCFDEPFWIDRYEVSQAQFAAFDGEADDTNSFEGDDLPRENITWHEARDFCEKRGARLPTEKEWEYAASGPDNLVYPWGNEWDASRVNSDFDTDDYENTAPVKAFPDGASWVGAEQMSGNVWEWVSSRYEPYPYEADDGRESLDANRLRVLRGGSRGDNNSTYFRAADRGRYPPDDRFLSNSFRCARLTPDSES